MDAADLVRLDATELARLVAAGEVTAVEVVLAHLDRIDAVGERVNAFVTVLAERALDAARQPSPGPWRNCARCSPAGSPSMTCCSARW